MISASTLRAHGLVLDRRASAALFPSRNLTCIAKTRAGRRVFVKAAVKGDAGVDAERFALHALAGLPGVPTIVAESEGLLAIEFIAGVPLSPWGEGPGEGERVGKALAVLQRTGARTPLSGRAVLGDFASRAIWPTPELYATSSKAVVTLISTVQQNAAAANTLTWLIKGEAAVEHTAVHGDCRHPNVLVSGKRVHFIDWEASGFGDPARDLGMLLADEYRSWLAPELPERVIPRAHLTRRLRALLHGWESEFGGADDLRRRRVTAWLAESLLRNEFSRAHHWHQVQQHVVDTALKLLAHPHEAVAHVFGARA